MRSLFLLLFFVTACSTSTTGDAHGEAGTDGGGGDLGGSDLGGSDLGSDGIVPDAGDIVCSGHDATSFPSFARSCTTDGDCTVALHTTDCCGSIAALGISAFEASRFGAAEAACEAMYPGCGCDSETVTTDDGGSGPRGSAGSAVVVRCDGSVCTTHVRAETPCGATTCTATQVCVMECSGIPTDASLPSHCVDVPSSCAATHDCSCYPTNPCPTGTCEGVDHGAPICLCA